MDKESKVHTMFKASRHGAPRVCVTHRKPLRARQGDGPQGAFDGARNKRGQHQGPLQRI